MLQLNFQTDLEALHWLIMAKDPCSLVVCSFCGEQYIVFGKLAHVLEPFPFCRTCQTHSPWHLCLVDKGAIDYLLVEADKVGKSLRQTHDAIGLLDAALIGIMRKTAVQAGWQDLSEVPCP